MSTTQKLCDKGCGNAVHGQGKRICDACAPRCACGQRRGADRPRCRSCAEVTARQALAAGRIVWIPNGRGTMVAAHLARRR